MVASEWDGDTFDRVLEQVRAEGTIDATGVRISGEQLARILEAAPEDPGRPGSPVLRQAQFSEAVFPDQAVFAGTTFEGLTQFTRATFEGLARFDGATFRGDAWFNDARFRGSVSRFDEATFADLARFDGAIFEDDAMFAGTTFERGAWFGWATFRDSAWFYGATMRGHTQFAGTRFHRNASFLEAVFHGTRQFGPVLALGPLVFERAVFDQPIRIEASAPVLLCPGAQFRRGVDLLLRRAEAALDEADFAEPSLLASGEEPVRGEETAFLEAGHAGREPTPRVLSVRRAKVANLTISGADLSACRFAGAHGLDQLRLEHVSFAQPPRGWQRVNRWRLPIRWTTRRVIAEERQWRAEQAGAGGWHGPDVQATSETETPPQPLLPEQIAPIYRALRKGREDGGDEPGAADFYYGEMEMRRHGRDERVILWLYWLVSGYGLRASRAVISLVVTVLVFAVLLYLVGLNDRDISAALLQSLEGAAFRGADETMLNERGQYLQLPLRLLGPLLLGLALISVRGRVKR